MRPTVDDTARLCPTVPLRSPREWWSLLRRREDPDGVAVPATRVQVMFRNPVPLVAGRLGVTGEIDRVAERRGRVRPTADRNEVEDGQSCAGHDARATASSARARSRSRLATSSRTIGMTSRPNSMGLRGCRKPAPTDPQPRSDSKAAATCPACRQAFDCRPPVTAAVASTGAAKRSPFRGGDQPCAGVFLRPV